MNSQVEIVEMCFPDRRGVRTLVWAVFYQGQLYSLEYTYGYSLMTNSVEFGRPMQAVA